MAVPGVDIPPDCEPPLEAEVPPGVITVPDGEITVSGDPVTPDDGRIADGDTVPGGAIMTGGTGGAGGIAVNGGATARGVITSLLSTQSGPFTCMHSGFASGTLSLRSVVSAAMTGAPVASKINIAVTIRFIVASCAKAGLSSSRARATHCMERGTP